MKILQVVTTFGQNCGIAFFAYNFQQQMQAIGIEVSTVATIEENVDPVDMILLHYHFEWLDNESIISLCERSKVPVILFAHSDKVAGFSDKVAGFMAMCPNMIPKTAKPVHIFSHPAWTPNYLEDRAILRNKFNLPENSFIVGTNGFLKFERQFVEILTLLLPQAQENNWFVNIITSPWYIESPGLATDIEKLQLTYSAYFKFENVFLNKETLNQKLQACDLLWCWTKAPSSPYASGVISDQYASGTAIFAADKLQHSHVLALPNVSSGANELNLFVEQLINQIKHSNRHRHDPTPVSWSKCVKDLALFFLNIHSSTKIV